MSHASATRESGFAAADHEEVYEAGDAFYVPTGHAPEAETGSEFVQFSPSDQLREVEETIMKNMQEMQGG